MNKYRQKLDAVLETRDAISYTAGGDYSAFGRVLTDDVTGEKFLWHPGLEPMGPLNEGDYLTKVNGTVVFMRKAVFEADWEPMPEPAPNPADPGVT